MIPRGKRKKRVGKERKKEREGQKGKTKKDPFLFTLYFDFNCSFLQFRYFNPSARFYLEYRTVPYL